MSLLCVSPTLSQSTFARRDEAHLRDWSDMCCKSPESDLQPQKRLTLSYMQDATGLLTGDANGYLVGQIFSDVFKVRAPTSAQQSAMSSRKGVVHP